MSASTASLQTDPLETGAALPAWKVELNRKLEAHRQRRGPGRLDVAAAGPDPEEQRESGRDDASPRTVAARVAAWVAERYAHAPSYSEVLAARAATAAAAAQAAALAVEQAQAAAEALLSSLSGGRQTVWGAKQAPQGSSAGWKKQDARSWWRTRCTQPRLDAKSRG